MNLMRPFFLLILFLFAALPAARAEPQFTIEPVGGKVTAAWKGTADIELLDHARVIAISVGDVAGDVNDLFVVELSEVTKALQQLDPVWEVLYPEEQSRVLELLVESVTVSKHSVDIHFRANGIEQIVDELTPMSERTDG